jgi:hypothetical protein
MARSRRRLLSTGALLALLLALVPSSVGAESGAPVSPSVLEQTAAPGGATFLG